jgi:hypothetical protein
MEQKERSELTDEQLLDEAKKIKSSSITNAVLIGFLIGIIIYSIVKNGFGFFILIPLFFANQLVMSSKKDKPL